MLIIVRIITSSSQTCCNMINELQKLSLSQEPGENAEAFASEVNHLCAHLKVPTNCLQMQHYWSRSASWLMLLKSSKPS
jgi:hypothetical protein